MSNRDLKKDDAALPDFPGEDPVAGKHRSAFLSDKEKEDLLLVPKSENPTVSVFFKALRKRVYARLDRNLENLGETTDWYYPAMEYLSDAALLYLIQPDDNLGRWLHNITLELVGKSAYEWAGPEFRDHSEPLTGHLETAHLSWAVAIVLDLTPEIFSTRELDEIREALYQKGILLCRRWVAANRHLANWRGILVSGIVVAAAVLEDEEILTEFVPQMALCYEAYQPDGSYAESLQYGNYLSFALMLAYESLVRKYPKQAAKLEISAYAKGIRWVATSMLYASPMKNWVTDQPVARAANFNDSAATFRPSGDLLLHIAARHNDALEAGLAKWLFDKYYLPVPEQGPHELSSFGMCNDWGFLTLPLWSKAPPAITPADAHLPLVTAFTNGHSFLRDAWDGQTIVAINGAGDKLYGPGHLHGDLNSFILVHHNTRLLADPGHSCYRNIIHGLESSSQTHNTCTFLLNSDSLGLQEDKAKASLLEQKSVLPRRMILPSGPGAPVDRQSKRQLLYQDGDISAIGTECGAAYGDPIEEFTRFWLLADANSLFVVDIIRAAKPVTTIWNWLVNNRDESTKCTVEGSELTVLRRNAGMKIFHLGSGTFSHPVYGYLHDAYHVKPNSTGEGRPGSGLVYRVTEKESQLSRIAVHAIALDTPDRLAEWQADRSPNSIRLANTRKSWTLKVNGNEDFSLISDQHNEWCIKRTNHQYQIHRNE